jgi:Na+-driven multidrug efflux pump
MRHTQLTVQNYASFSLVVLTLGLVTVGFGTVDLLMVAPKGLTHVAAVGQGDLIVAGVYAFFIGVVDTFSSRLAVSEGEGRTGARLPVLVAALLVLLVPCQLLALAFVAGTEPLLSLLGQSREVIPLVGDYVAVRICSLAPVIVYFAASEALKICGAKNLSAWNLVAGFAVNAALNWVFLYTGFADSFSSPEAAVATSSVLAQTFMAVCGAWLFVRQMRARNEHLRRPTRPEVSAEFRSMARTAPGVGARHLNDYAGSLLPLMFIGTMGVHILAPAVVATKIYTLFCRVPQACFSATFVFYGYALGRDGSNLAAVLRRLRAYAAAPTVLATLLVLPCAPWLVAAFASDGLDKGLAQSLLFAYLLYVPAYFFEQFSGELLTVHQRGGLLFTASTLVTYALTVPLAWLAVSTLHSAFAAIAVKGLSTAVLALVFWRALSAYGRVRSTVSLA